MGQRLRVIELALFASSAANLLAIAALVYAHRTIRSSSRAYQRHVDALLDREQGLLDRISDLAGRPWNPSPAETERRRPEPQEPRIAYSPNPGGLFEHEAVEIEA